MATIKNTVISEFKETGAKKVAGVTDQVTKAQTRLGQASASAGRAFSAQATGLGGLVSAYAGAAATVFAITAAFQALNQAAQTAQVVEGLNALATTVGTTGSEILKRSQEITRGLVSIREAAETVNIGLSAGFSQDQILELQQVSLGASRALGRTLTDALTRVTRGAAKLEPELLDELGIFVKIDPAVESYAAKLNKTASSLTDFERRQAFVNAIIDQGTQKFSIIDTSSGNALESLQRLSTVIVDLGAKVGAALANFIAPFADFISGDLGNTLAVFGLLARTVFGNALAVAQSGIQKTSARVDELANSLGERLAKNAEKQGIAFGKLAIATEDLDLRLIKGSRSIQKADRELIKLAKTGELNVQQLDDLRIALKRQEQAADQAGDEVLKYSEALKRAKQAQAATGKSALLLSGALSRSAKAFRIAAIGITSALRGITSFITAISVARLALKPFTDALGITDEIDLVAKSLFNFTLRLLGVDEASKSAKKGFEGIASSLLSANEAFSELPDKIEITTKKFFGLANITEQLSKQELAGLFTELLSNLNDPSAIEDFRSEFSSATFEGRVALEAIINKAIEFKSTFAELGPQAAGAFGEINRQTGIASKSLAEFITLQKQSGGGFGSTAVTKSVPTPFGGTSSAVVELIGSQNEFNLVLEETGEKLKIQSGDTKLINNLIAQGNIKEAERLSIGAGIIGLLAQESAFRKEIEAGNLSGEQIKRKEFALQTRLTDLLERAKKLKDDELLLSLALVDASNDKLASESEIQTQQDLLNKRLRKDFSAQIAAADKLNGLASIDNELATNKQEIEANQLSQVAAILKTRREGTKETELQNSASKIAGGLVQEQLVAIRKIREEQEKITQKLERQLAILQKQNAVKDAQRNLKLLREENKISEQLASNAEKLRLARAKQDQRSRDTSLKALEEEAELQKQLLDRESVLFTEAGLKDLKIQIDEGVLAELKANTEKAIAERVEALANEQKLLEQKATNDIAVLEQEKVIAEQNAALQLEQVKQDQIKFDAEAKLRQQRIDELKTQANIFDQFIENFATLLSNLSADIKVATDPALQAKVAAGADVDVLRQAAQKEGFDKLLPQLRTGLDVSGLEAGSQNIRNLQKNITDMRIEEIAKEERSIEESLERRQKVREEQLTFEKEIARLAAQGDIDALMETVNARQAAIDAQKALNAQFDIFKILQLSVADNMKKGLESAFVSLNQQLIEGTLTMNSIGDTFKDMLGGMLRAIQQEVFTTSIAKPAAAAITSLFTGAAGGLVHLAAGGTMKRDRVPAMLEPGEFVIRKEAAKKLGMSKLAEMNAGVRPDPIAMLIARLSGSKVRGMASGGGIGFNKETADALLGFDTETKKGMGGALFSAALGLALKGTPVGMALTAFGLAKKGMALSKVGQIKDAGGSSSGITDTTLTKEEIEAKMDAAKATGTVVGTSINPNAFRDGGFSQGMSFSTQFGGIGPRPSVNLSVIGKGPGPIDSGGGDGGGATAAQMEGFSKEGGPGHHPGGLAAGGLIRAMAAGGLVRDRVPAMLEPGEFVIRKPMAKAIGGAVLSQMNSTGKPPEVSVNVNNTGAPKDVAVKAPKMNGNKVIIDLITKDLQNNGAIKKSLRKK